MREVSLLKEWLLGDSISPEAEGRDNIMRMFNSPSYNDRMKFIDGFFEKNIESNEIVEVNAGGRCNDQIIVSYSCINNHKYNSETFYLPPELMLVLTDATIVQILKELLATARSKNG